MVSSILTGRGRRDKRLYEFGESRALTPRWFFGAYGLYGTLANLLRQ